MSSSSSPVPQRNSFRSTGSIIAIIATGILAIFFIVDAIVRAGWYSGFLLAPWALGLVWIVYAVSFSSFLAYDADGVTVQNYLVRRHLPWDAIQDLAVRWQIEFLLRDGRVVKAVGGPSGVAVRRAPRPEGKPLRADVDYVERLKEAQEWRRSGGEVTRSLDVPALVVLGALLLWITVSVTLTR